MPVWSKYLTAYDVLARVFVKSTFYTDVDRQDEPPNCVSCV